MNVDLLPPSFAAAIDEPLDRACGDCSSWREHGIYSGWCLMLGRPRGPRQTADYIGRIRKERIDQGAVLWLRLDGDAGYCFTPSTDTSRIVKRSETAKRYVPVTRTETAKSGRISASEGV